MNDGTPSSVSNVTARHPLRIGDPAPDFQARTSQGEMRLADFRGKWLLFFSHPADFTPVCTSEFMALAREYPRFEAMGCALMGLSVDSLYSHLAWLEAIRARFGVEVPFPVVEDPSMAVGHAYGMLSADAHDSATVRATYFIDPTGIVRAIIWYPMSVGRSVDELLRLLAALQRSADGDVMTPEGWRPGGDVLGPVPMTQAQMRDSDASGCWFYPIRPDSRAPRG